MAVLLLLFAHSMLLSLLGGIWQVSLPTSANLPCAPIGNVQRKCQLFCDTYDVTTLLESCRSGETRGVCCPVETKRTLIDTGNRTNGDPVPSPDYGRPDKKPADVFIGIGDTVVKPGDTFKGNGGVGMRPTDIVKGNGSAGMKPVDMFKESEGGVKEHVDVFKASEDTATQHKVDESLTIDRSPPPRNDADCRPIPNMNVLCAPTSDCPRHFLRAHYDQPEPCEYRGELPGVCCPVSVDVELIPVVDSQPTCGYQSYDLNRTATIDDHGLTPGSITTDVINGEPATVGAWPWMARLGTTKWGPKPLYKYNCEWYCGAVLVSPNYVLTAAHCILKGFRFQYKVRIGEVDFSRQDETRHQDRLVQRAMRHPQYHEKRSIHDLALLKLVRPAVINNLVRHICLPSGPERDFTGLPVQVAGWGRTAFNDYDYSQPERLLEANLTVIDSYQCQKTFEKMRSFSASFPNGFQEYMVCANDLTGRRRDACAGDSGGPLIYRDHKTNQSVLVATVVAGWGCGSSGLYARVAAYSDWIRRIISR